VSGLIEEQLARWIEAGGGVIGQIAISGTTLCHLADVERGDVEIYGDPFAAQHLAVLDDAGEYRPLKTAPNLKRGWRLELESVHAVRLALDFFYPAVLGMGLAWRGARLEITPLRETLDRQTGMYACVKHLDDVRAAEMAERFCAGCLRVRLWQDQRPPEGVTFPLLCREACNLLVAEARKVVKGQA